MVQNVPSRTRERNRIFYQPHPLPWNDYNPMTSSETSCSQIIPNDRDIFKYVKDTAPELRQGTFLRGDIALLLIEDIRGNPSPREIYLEKSSVSRSPLHALPSLCFRPLLKQIKNSAESHIVLDCSTERIYDVLKQAQQIGMMSDYHSYLITSLVSLFIKWECN